MSGAGPPRGQKAIQELVNVEHRTAPCAVHVRVLLKVVLLLCSGESNTGALEWRVVQAQAVKGGT